MLGYSPIRPQAARPTRSLCFDLGDVSAAARGRVLRCEGWPLTGWPLTRWMLTRWMFTELHGIPLHDGRGHERLPGQYRTSQNWIGGTRPGNAVYAPPPASEVSRCMGELERFSHQPKTDLEPLLTAGIAHAMLESIHPFLDGNGRLCPSSFAAEVAGMGAAP